MMIQRYAVFFACVGIFLGSLALWQTQFTGWWVIAGIFGFLSFVGIWDLVQKRHSVLRNYPIVAHFRYFAEDIRPEIRQYFIESDTDGRPFSRVQRSLIYARAKNIKGYEAFGTELDVYGREYNYLRHSIKAHDLGPRRFRIEVGGEQCEKPYSCSLLNISAMSFGAISPRAIEALNLGAKKNEFYHCTGEGGVSPYHLKHGGDLVWQIGTGYFGCRTDDGHFNPEKFASTVSSPAIRMVEIKISQGAKPGHGGVLPAAKVTPEIAATRGVKQGVDCISPPGHTAFKTPLGLCEFIASLRKISGGLPIGFKLCVGFEGEFFSICKAMLETGILPDFITVDGGEGGTGAAPVEFSDHVGMPLFEGLNFVHNALVGCHLRDKIHIAASGKVYSAASLLRCIILGADWCNAARAFMMTVGCIQSQRCHTNTCPVGVATQDKNRQRALHIMDKAERVYQFHRNTIKVVNQIVGAAGLESPRQFTKAFLAENDPIHRLCSTITLEPGQLLEGKGPTHWQRQWALARADEFVSV